MRKFFDHQRETKTEDALERPVMIVFLPSAHDAVVVPACALGRKKEGLVSLLAGCAWDSSQRSRTREEMLPEEVWATFSHFNTGQAVRFELGRQFRIVNFSTANSIFDITT